ncbi:MAG: retropepsin-like aspartic protease [Reyranella sp.]|nr:retropepsin-like aspartic protease [Reyranella sp.]
MRSTLSLLASIAVLSGAVLSDRAAAQDSGGAPQQVIAAWRSNNETCRSPAATALAAVAACEQRDTYAKRLMQMNFCPDAQAAADAWRPCPTATAATPPRTTVQLARAGGIFVAPVVLNGTVKQFAILDSGASNLQIPQEVADELRRNGSLTDDDGLGQRRYILADGKGVQQRVFRLRTLQIGDKVMENVVATVSAPNSRVLLGQSVLRRLNGWAIDNVRNTLTLD